MVTSKQTILLGTSGISNCNRILVYNNQTFLNNYINNALGLEDFEINIVKQNPSRNNIESIYNILINHIEFSPIDHEKSSKNLYIFDNNKLNCIDGQGFNIILFLKNNSILGFTELIDVQGSDYSESKELVKLKRDYSIKYISVFLNYNENKIKIDEHVIKLFDNIPTNNLKNRNLPFIKSNSGILNKKFKLSKNYVNSIPELINNISNKIFLNSSIVECDSVYTGDYKVVKLNIKKNIYFDDTFKKLNHIQFGYYKNDIVVFLWSDDNEYSIYSITTYLGDLFNDPVKKNLNKLKPYTIPISGIDEKILFSNEVYKLPLLNYSKLTIEYFSGKYIICSNNGVYYLFDWTNQSNNVGWIIRSYEQTNNIKYYTRKDNKWVDYQMFDTKKIYDSLDLVPTNITNAAVYESFPIYENNFIVDTLDPFAKVYQFKNNNWQSYEEAFKEFPEISNVFANSEKLIMNGNQLVKKVGDWLVFYNKFNSIKTYTNYTKSIRFRIDEEEPIIVNNQVLIGKSNDTYTIYNEDGYYISPLAKEYLSIKFDTDIIEDDESYNHKYIEYNTKDHSNKFSTINEKTSLLEFRKGFWKYFSRNSLPKSMENLKIIGAFKGLIFYSLGNNINYL